MPTTAPASPSSPAATQTPASGANSSGANSSGNTSAQSASGGASGATNSTSTLSIPQTVPAGGVTFTQPPQMSTSFYKIAQNQPITFGWNYTSLYVTPQHLTISAFCSQNGNRYPVGASDGVVPGNATQVVWDVYSYNQANQATPLAALNYKLEVYDERGAGAVPQPGRFSPNTNLQFGLYQPAQYTSLADGWQCLGCKSGALERATAHPAFAALIATLVICMVSGYSLLRRQL